MSECFKNECYKHCVGLCSMRSTGQWVLKIRICKEGASNNNHSLLGVLIFFSLMLK